MIVKIIRGKQEDTVESVEDRQVVQADEEEEMKTDNMKGSESNENIENSGKMTTISMGASPKRTKTENSKGE
jgi:hypothetical protein